MKRNTLALALGMVVLMAVAGKAQFQQQQQPCPGECSKEFKPVCGSDGITYDNLCLLQDENRCNNPQLTIVTASECGKQTCPGVCTEELAPVCASDGESYDNLCLFLDERRCDNHNLTLVSNGPCEGQQHQDCPGVCTLEFNPVCGSDGKTYDNLCQFVSEMRCNNPHLELVSRGECRTDPHQGCPGICTFEYNPVCGSDGRTYGNLCQLKAERRCRNPFLRLVRRGECAGQHPCIRVCTEEYAPLCGSDGRTYSNLCYFEAEKRCYNPQLFVVSKGECERVPPPGQQCGVVCTLQYDPVCGSDGNTYGNLCLLTAQQKCFNPLLQFVRRGECGVGKECPGFCTLEYNPVCGSDGVTYGNLCQLELTRKCRNPALHLAYRGECRVSPGKCPVMCPSRYAPVCGTDGRTYPNACELAMFACQRKGLRVKYSGRCRAPHLY